MNIKNVEVININTKEGKLTAVISYQDADDISFPNNGYNSIEVPVNIRELQYSAYDNLLVDQSVKGESIVAVNS